MQVQQFLVGLPTAISSGIAVLLAPLETIIITLGQGILALPITLQEGLTRIAKALQERIADIRAIMQGVLEDVLAFIGELIEGAINNFAIVLSTIGELSEDAIEATIDLALRIQKTIGGKISAALEAEGI